MIELRKLKCSCDFGDFLNQVLWNRYVCRLVNTNTLKQLLSEKDLTLKSTKMAVLESPEVKKTVVEPDNQDEYINGDSDLGRTTRLTHSIHTGNEAPIPGEFHIIRDKKLKAAGGLHRSNGMILNSNMLRSSGLWFKLSKCVLCRREVIYPGHKSPKKEYPHIQTRLTKSYIYPYIQVKVIFHKLMLA